MNRPPSWLLLLACLASAAAFSDVPQPWWLRAGVALVVLLVFLPGGQWKAAAVSLLAGAGAAYAGRYLRSDAFVLFTMPAADFGYQAPARPWLLLHASAGVTALLLGPANLWSGFRPRPGRLHRALGWLYLAGVALGGMSVFLVAPLIAPSEGGRNSSVSMVILALLWMAATAYGLALIKRGDLARHRRWMIRSYLFTYAFVSIRWLLGLRWVLALGPISVVAPAAIQASWLLPIALAECWWRFSDARTVRLPGVARAATPRA